VHEFLAEPVTAKALHERLASVLLNSPPMVKRDDHYGPAPRKLQRPPPDFQDLRRQGDPGAKAVASRRSTGQPRM
jgi:hypothetical protein